MQNQRRHIDHCLIVPANPNANNFHGWMLQNAHAILAIYVEPMGGAAREEARRALLSISNAIPLGNNDTMRRSLHDLSLVSEAAADRTIAVLVSAGFIIGRMNNSLVVAGIESVSSQHGSGRGAS